MKKTETYDVVAVDLDTCRVVSIYAENKTLRSAEAVVNMAVMRQGVDERFFAEVPSGKYRIGDEWEGDE